MRKSASSSLLGKASARFSLDLGFNQDFHCAFAIQVESYHLLSSAAANTVAHTCPSLNCS
jgi:hypothetical protein